MRQRQGRMEGRTGVAQKMGIRSHNAGIFGPEDPEALVQGRGRPVIMSRSSLYLSEASELGSVQRARLVFVVELECFAACFYSQQVGERVSERVSGMDSRRATC